MRMISCVAASLLLCATMACSKKEEAKAGDKKDDKAGKKTDDKGGGGGGGGKLDDAEKYVLERAQANLKEVKDKLTKGEEISTTDCASVLGFSDQLAAKKDVPEVAAVLADADKTCGYDAPLATMERETKKAEEARAKDPKGAVLSECFNAYADTAMKELKKKHAADAKVVELDKRWLAACPPKQ